MTLSPHLMTIHWIAPGDLRRLPGRFMPWLVSLTASLARHGRGEQSRICHTSAPDSRPECANQASWGLGRLNWALRPPPNRRSSPTPHIAARIPLTDATDAMELAESHTVLGKVVLVP
jgi:hypothetical protein